jgi:hypothetical protein
VGARRVRRRDAYYCDHHVQDPPESVLLSRCSLRRMDALASDLGRRWRRRRVHTWTDAALSRNAGIAASYGQRSRGNRGGANRGFSLAHDWSFK